jgi:tetratricopeptide (TPR) repeat protein
MLAGQQRGEVRLRPRALLLLVAIVVAPAPVRADATHADAKAAYNAAAAAYEAGDYQTAIDGFLKAYELSKKPVILFDVARAETKLGHEQLAIDYLKRYLAAAPDAIDAPSVRAEIAAREQAMASHSAKAAAEAEALSAKRDAEEARRRAQATEEAAAVERARAAEQREHRKKWPGPLVLGLGVAAVAGGIAGGVVALRSADTVSHGGASAPGALQVPFSGRYSSAQDSGRAGFAAGVALDVVGGLAIAAGVAWTIWAFHQPRGRRLHGATR